MKKLLSLLLILTLTLSLAACSGNGNAPAAGSGENSPEAEGTSASQEDPAGAGAESVVLGSLGYFPNSGWDAGSGYEGWYIASYGVAETLYRIDENFEAYPWLAQSAEQLDSLTWRLELRDGVTFTNGAAMTAEAVKACFERNMANNDTAASLPIASIEAEGQTLTIHLESASINFLREIANPTYWCVYDAAGSEDFARESFFTGPYRPVSFVPNEKIELVRNENYWGERPKFATATLLTVDDVSTLLMAFQNGEIDIVVPVPDESIQSYLELDHTEVARSLGGRAQFFRFNMNSPVMADAAVREAISLCVDREGYASSICHGLVEPSYGVFPANMAFGGTDKLQLTVDRYDTARAKQLLEEAGYQDTNGDGVLEKDGTPLSVHIVALASQTAQVQLCQVLESDLKQIGFAVSLEVVENINDARSAGAFDLCCESFNMASNGNPTSFINRMFATGGSTNYGGYSNAEVDRLIQEMNAAADLETQYDRIEKISQQIADDCSFIFFAHKYFTGAYNTTKIGNYESQPCEYYILDSSTAPVQ